MTRAAAYDPEDRDWLEGGCCEGCGCDPCQCEDEDDEFLAEPNPSSHG